MAKVGHAVGLSYQDLGEGRFRLHWRQWEEQPGGGRQRAQRSVTAYSVDERRRLELDIEKALAEKGWWSASELVVAAKPVDVNLERAGLAWLDWKSGLRAVSASTRRNLAGSMRRWFDTLRTARGWSAETVIPGNEMSQATLAEVGRHLRERYAEGTVYQTISAVVDMWTWAASQDEYASLPRPPYNLQIVMPRPADYHAPDAVPAFAECDAAIRNIRLPIPRRLAILMRYTGLRLEQAVHVHREDLDLRAGTLLIRKGKSRREKATMRRVPVSPHLVADLRPWLETRLPGPLFPDPKDAKIPLVSYRNQTRYVTEGWRTATQNGDARLEVWAPPSRSKTRPDHAFRAAFQAALADVGVSDSTIDWLVGHAPKTTRARHYARPSDNVLRQAVAKVDPIAWDGIDPLSWTSRKAQAG
jgi:integrase